jgi:hypothetical protein
MLKTFYASLVLAVVTAMPVVAQRDVNDRFWVAADGYIRLHVQTGNLRVQGWDKDTIAITGIVNYPADGEYVRSPGKQGAKVSVWSMSDAPGKPSDLLIRVPRRSRLWVKTQDAHVNISEFNGGVDVITTTGNVEIAGNLSEVYVESMAGEVNLGVSTRSARVKTASGKVTLRGVIDDATVSTITGPIFTIDARFRQGRFDSLEGAIQHIGDPASPSSLEFVNHAGTIELALTPKASAYFAVSLIDGSFRDEFGLRIKQGTGKLKSRDFSFSLGNAPDTEINIRSFKGAVVIRKIGFVKKAND